MSEQRTIPNESTHDVVTFDILTDGNRIDPGYQIISVAITKEINRIPIARVVVRDGDAAEESFEISNKNDFIPGKEILIKIGRDREHETVFKGIITKHAIKIRESGDANLVIEARDKSVRMTIGRHSRYFEKRKDSEIIEELIGQYAGLSKDVEATTLKHQEVVQVHSTDWDFIMSRADVNGKLVIVDDGKVSVKKPDTSTDPVLTLGYGSTILACDAEMDARYQWKKVVAKSWDYSNQSLFEASTESASFAEHGNITGKKLAETINLKEVELRHSGHVLAEELTEWAKASMLKSRLAKIRGRARIMVGSSLVKPGTMVKLEGLGERFNGKAYVTAVRHELGNGEWDTHIQFGLDPKWFACAEDIIDFPAAGLMPAINGLQIGKVLQLQEDPDGEDRILVKLPIIDPNGAGVWSRVASLDAGNDRGAFFRPEIDDEVIVGFVNDDPRDAVVLGMLHSSKNPAPITAEDVNHEKGFTTRSKMHIHFNDDTKTITIDTPAGNSITIDEASKSIKIVDQNNNSISMEPKGITVDSPKEVTINAGTNITIKAGAQMSIEAAQIGIKASGPLTAEGATAKLSSPGITEIAGSLVKIN